MGGGNANTASGSHATIGGGLNNQAAGFYAAHMPEEVGGKGLSTLGTALLVEDAAHSGLRLAIHAVAPKSRAQNAPYVPYTATRYGLKAGSRGTRRV